MSADTYGYQIVSAGRVVEERRDYYNQVDRVIARLTTLAKHGRIPPHGLISILKNGEVIEQWHKMGTLL